MKSNFTRKNKRLLSIVLAIAVIAAIWVAEDGGDSFVRMKYSLKNKLGGGDGCVVKDTPIYLTVGDIDFAVPIAYLKNGDNWEGGKQSFINVSVMYDDLSPICFRPLTEREIKEGKTFPYYSTKDPSFGLNIQSGYPDFIKIWAEKIKAEPNTRFAGNEGNYELYEQRAVARKTEQGEIFKDGTDYLISEGNQLGAPHLIKCHVKRYRDGETTQRRGCSLHFSHFDHGVRLRVSSIHPDELDKVPELYNKATKLLEILKRESGG